MIKIIEKEPYKSFDRWKNRECLMYPNFMLKDEKEYFVLNRREPESSSNKQENQKILDKLKETNGKYTFFYGQFENPFEMLEDIILKRHLIIADENRPFDSRMTNEGSIDFHGNRDVYSSAFMYRIFDNELEKTLRQIVTFVNSEEWNKAEKELKKARCKYKDFEMNKDRLQENEELEN